MEYINITASTVTSIWHIYITFEKPKNYLDNTLNTECTNVECAPFDYDSEEEMQNVGHVAQVASLQSSIYCYYNDFKLPVPSELHSCIVVS